MANSLGLKAIRLAQLIFNAVESYRGKWRFEDSVAMILGDPEVPRPEINELILCGSVARGEDDPGDIDFILFDNDYFSDDILGELTRRTLQEDFYSLVGGNLITIMTTRLGVTADELEQVIDHTPVDLYVLPISFLKDIEGRRQIASLHRDRNFFRNVMRDAKRYDKATRTFVPMSLEYLERTYGHDLSDLK